MRLQAHDSWAGRRLTNGRRSHFRLAAGGRVVAVRGTIDGTEVETWIQTASGEEQGTRIPLPAGGNLRSAGHEGGWEGLLGWTVMAVLVAVCWGLRDILWA